MQHSAASPLVVSRAAPDEWSVVGSWAAAEGWNPGLSDTECFFAQDPDGFFIGRVGGEPVSAVSVVNYSPEYAFLGFYLVRPGQRGRGYGLATWNAALVHAGARTVGLDGVPAQQDNYRCSGFVFAHRNLRCSGTLCTSRRAPAHVVSAKSAGMQAITAYDSTCYPAARPDFLRRWVTGDGHRAVACVDGGRLTGYGVLRPALEGARIGPLFADTPGDARALLEGLVAGCGPVQVAIDVPQSNPDAVALAGSLGLTPSFETARMYTGTGPRTPHRVYGISSLELG